MISVVFRTCISAHHGGLHRAPCSMCGRRVHLPFSGAGHFGVDNSGSCSSWTFPLQCARSRRPSTPVSLSKVGYRHCSVLHGRRRVIPTHIKDPVVDCPRCARVKKTALKSAAQQQKAAKAFTVALKQAKAQQLVAKATSPIRQRWSAHPRRRRHGRFLAYGPLFHNLFLAQQSGSQRSRMAVQSSRTARILLLSDLRPAGRGKDCGRDPCFFRKAGQRRAAQQQLRRRVGNVHGRRVAVEAQTHAQGPQGAVEDRRRRRWRRGRRRGAKTARLR